MNLATILLADDQQDSLATWSDIIRREGYTVITASSPSEARNILETQPIDVAILDLRLEDGGPEDTSGLVIAKTVAPHVPKIILTAYQDGDATIDALRVNSEGLPYAVDWVKKQGDYKVLTAAIRKALALKSKFRPSISTTSSQLDQDYHDARSQTIVNYWIASVASIGGIILVFSGAALVFKEILAIGVLSAVAGVITEAIGYLAFKRVDGANERMDRYHNESLQIKSLEILLDACEELPAEQEQSLKSTIIDKAATRWLDRDKSSL